MMNSSKKNSDLPLFGNVPSIDLHGETKDVARVLINDFIDDAIKMKEDKIVIIHGIGKRVLKKEVHGVLKNDKRVENFYINFFNDGCTIVELKKNYLTK